MKRKPELTEINGKIVEVRTISKRKERQLLQERADARAEKFWQAVVESERRESDESI
jgi:hypothetical protein